MGAIRQRTLTPPPGRFGAQEMGFPGHEPGQIASRPFPASSRF